jgi:hypothetical protein
MVALERIQRNFKLRSAGVSLGLKEILRARKKLKMGRALKERRNKF